MLFEDRADAGQQLAAALAPYRGANPLVLAIPRGGVPLALKVADALSGELDVVLVRKLGAPHNPEFAVGAVGESGHWYVSDFAERAGADAPYLADEAARQMQTIRQRRQQYDQVHQAVPIAGRTVIVVDDGLATGATMCMALQEIRVHHPARVICAVPVASPDAVGRVRPLCDEIVCLGVEAEFGGVGQFYRDFSQVDDSEVLEILRGK
jgi:putative phosphoribosyl transferase